MKRSSERILTTHMGGLPRADDLTDLATAKDLGQPYDRGAYRARVTDAVQEAVAQQRVCGIDVVNDGEVSKSSWSGYLGGRLAGTEARELQPGQRPVPGLISDRDVREFPAWFATAAALPGGFGMVHRLANQGRPPVPNVGTYCVGPLTYIGQAEVRADIANLTSAAPQHSTEELFLTALGPGMVVRFMGNEYYTTEQDFLAAAADALRAEYRAITDAGIVLQIDEPILASGWQVFPDVTVAEWRRWVQLRVDALNRSLQGIPPDRVRLHVCWGSGHFPHKNDIPLRDILDLILQVNVAAYSFEASNPGHEWEWEVWQDMKLPDGTIVIPGVIGHFTDFIEHPGTVAQRILNYARVVGRENVIAGTDCGIGTRVGHASICWAKFRAMTEGARIASVQLWGRGTGPD
jgi:5-methyltetrahydropteroyltriglutamate--homocysteine methyltransferase